MMTMLKTCILNRESSECSECLHQAGDVQCPPGDDDKDEGVGDSDGKDEGDVDIDDNGDNDDNNDNKILRNNNSKNDNGKDNNSRNDNGKKTNQVHGGEAGSLKLVHLGALILSTSRKR